MAVVAQPFDRGAKIPAPGKVDPSLKEWWVENPWDIAAQGKNLSSYERNRAFLNVADPKGGRTFLEISTLTGADSDGDGRCSVAGDFRNNGQQDLLVRQISGGSILFYENRFPRRHYFEVSLRGLMKDFGQGKKSNRLGIGARILATVNGRKMVREMYPLNSFASQAPTVAHFGLGDADRVETLEIRWPSGLVQVLDNLAADRHVVVEEGNSVVETVQPGRTIRP
jgi:hypothetical protein